MSRPHPPLDLLVRMGKSEINVLTSIACLAAALAVQRGDFTEPTIEDCLPSGSEVSPALSPEAKASLLAAIRKVRDAFVTAPPDVLQSSIDLYVAHLKYCGFRAAWGQGSDS